MRTTYDTKRHFRNNVHELISEWEEANTNVYLNIFEPIRPFDSGIWPFGPQ